jgi:hypothetical protein
MAVAGPADQLVARVVVAYRGVDDAPVRLVHEPLLVASDVTVRLGRKDDVLIGTEPEDRGISRHALVVTAAQYGWQVQFTNGNGAAVYLWGQPRIWVGGRSEQQFCWPRVGIRLIGSSLRFQYWVLLEADRYAIVDAGVSVSRAGSTNLRDRPRPLTRPQLAAVTTVFAQHLAWPPLAAASSMKLATAARRLGISTTGVQDRLGDAQVRARQLGWDGTASLMDPDYLYVLVRSGYLPVPDQFAPTSG